MSVDPDWASDDERVEELDRDPLDPRLDEDDEAMEATTTLLAFDHEGHWDV